MQAGRQAGQEEGCQGSSLRGQMTAPCSRWDPGEGLAFQQNWAETDAALGGLCGDFVAFPTGPSRGVTRGELVTTRGDCPDTHGRLPSYTRAGPEPALPGPRLSAW